MSGSLTARSPEPAHERRSFRTVIRRTGRLDSELDHLEKSWSAVARRDLLQAILYRRDQPWTKEAFFQTGKDDFARIKSISSAHGIAIGDQTDILDFGCGIGRLSLPAAAIARSVIGVDISEEMIRRAPTFVAGRTPPLYLRCRSADLDLISSSSIDVVMSLITFQHMSPMLGAIYVRGFARILRPNGLLIFDVASKKASERTLAEALPSWAYKVCQNVRASCTSYGKIRMHAWPDGAVQALIGQA
ncbi:MAG: hypothetical protein QOK07_1436, partial [Gemmatimonadaceae bacterium]|nr:hypothetical protein [Gemmatimonadaceae bacterium]